jgi:ethanolamine transporter EutH
MLEQFAWLQPVLIAAAVVFVLDLIGNMLSFSSRFMNALVTALVFAVLFGGLIHLGVVQLDVKTVPMPSATEAPAPAPTQ